MRMAKLAIAPPGAHTPGRVALPHGRYRLTDGEHSVDNTQLVEDCQTVGLQHKTDAFGRQLGSPLEDRHA